MLNREEIRKLVSSHNLVSGYIDLETQLTPNGIDLTINQIYAFSGRGNLDFSNKERVLPATELLIAEKNDDTDQYGWWTLGKGAYKVVTNEIVKLPLDLIGMAFPRSSLLRMGVFTQTGVWDAGFNGRSEFILIVENAEGAKIKRNSRVVQLMFTRINETGQGYEGVYQGL